MNILTDDLLLFQKEAGARHLINDFLELVGLLKVAGQRDATHIHVFPEMRLSLAKSLPGPAKVAYNSYITFLTGFADYAIAAIKPSGWRAEAFGESPLPIFRSCNDH